MIRKYPGLGAAELAEKLRADIPSGLDPEQGRLFVEAVVARLPERVAEKQEEKQEDFSATSAWVLVAANLLPLYAVLFWNWEVFALLVLFWMENAIIGTLNAARMLVMDPGDMALWAGKLFLVPFFCVHYGIFTAVHGMFVFSMFGPTGKNDLLESATRAIGEWNLWLPLGALLSSHLFSFFWNYLYRGEFRRASLPDLMFRPYVRVMILHLTILLGGFAAMALGSPLWTLLVLLGLKIALDLKAHLRERRV